MTSKLYTVNLCIESDLSFRLIVVLCVLAHTDFDIDIKIKNLHKHHAPLHFTLFILVARNELVNCAFEFYVCL